VIQTIASAAPISALRRRMIEDMIVRGFGEKTQSDYIRHVKNEDQLECTAETAARNALG
jgi:hypothetical protein